MLGKKLSSAVAVWAGLAATGPSATAAVGGVDKRGSDCSSPAWGLDRGDCEHMSAIGIAGQGQNDRSNNGRVWIGNDGPATFTFYNRVDPPASVVLLTWDMYGSDDYQAMCLNARTPRLSLTIAAGGSVDRVGGQPH